MPPNKRKVQKEDDPVVDSDSEDRINESDDEEEVDVVYLDSSIDSSNTGTIIKSTTTSLSPTQKVWKKEFIPPAKDTPFSYDSSTSSKSKSSTSFSPTEKKIQLIFTEHVNYARHSSTIKSPCIDELLQLLPSNELAAEGIIKFLEPAGKIFFSNVVNGRSKVNFTEGMEKLDLAKGNVSGVYLIVSEGEGETYVSYAGSSLATKGIALEKLSEQKALEQVLESIYGIPESTRLMQAFKSWKFRFTGILSRLISHLLNLKSNLVGTAIKEAIKNNRKVSIYQIAALEGSINHLTVAEGAIQVIESSVAFASGSLEPTSFLVGQLTKWKLSNEKSRLSLDITRTIYLNTQPPLESKRDIPTAKIPCEIPDILHTAKSVNSDAKTLSRSKLPYKYPTTNEINHLAGNINSDPIARKLTIDQALKWIQTPPSFPEADAWFRKNFPQLVEHYAKGDIPFLRIDSVTSAALDDVKEGESLNLIIFILQCVLPTGVSIFTASKGKWQDNGPTSKFTRDDFLPILFQIAKEAGGNVTFGNMETFEECIGPFLRGLYLELNGHAAEDTLQPSAPLLALAGIFIRVRIAILQAMGHNVLGVFPYSRQTQMSLDLLAPKEPLSYALFGFASPSLKTSVYGSMHPTMFRKIVDPFTQSLVYLRQALSGIHSLSTILDINDDSPLTLPLITQIDKAYSEVTKNLKIGQKKSLGSIFEELEVNKDNSTFGYLFNKLNHLLTNTRIEYNRFGGYSTESSTKYYAGRSMAFDMCVVRGIEKTFQLSDPTYAIPWNDSRISPAIREYYEAVGWVKWNASATHYEGFTVLEMLSKLSAAAGVRTKRKTLHETSPGVFITTLLLAAQKGVETKRNTLHEMSPGFSINTHELAAQKGVETKRTTFYKISSGVFVNGLIWAAMKGDFTKETTLHEQPDGSFLNTHQQIGLDQRIAIHGPTGAPNLLCKD